MNSHAYLIIANRNFNQLALLLKTLDDSRNDIYLLIDKKAGSQILHPELINARLTILPRINIYWGDYSLIQAEINLLKIATKTKHSIYHLISGLDLPIAGQDEIHNFFDSHIGENFLTYSATIPKNKLKMRIKKYNFTKHFRDYNIFLRIYRQLEKVELGLIQKDKLPIDLIGYGSNWCSISHELAREIVCSENLIFKIFNKGFLVDELFIPTLINIRGKSKFPIYYEKPVHNISDEFQGNLRYINWWDGSPKTWRISDFD